VVEASVLPMSDRLLRLFCALFVGGQPDVAKVRDRLPGDANEVRKIGVCQQQHVIEHARRYLKLARAVAVVPRAVRTVRLPDDPRLYVYAVTVG
jgi:hypothetical protein